MAYWTSWQGLLPKTEVWDPRSARQAPPGFAGWEHPLCTVLRGHIWEWEGRTMNGGGAEWGRSVERVGNEGACTEDLLGSLCPCGAPGKGRLLALQRAAELWSPCPLLEGTLALWMQASCPHSSWLPPRKTKSNTPFATRRFASIWSPHLGCWRNSHSPNHHNIILQELRIPALCLL